MKKIFIILAICLLMVGCKTTSSYKLTPEVLEGQKRMDRGGIEDIVSHKKASVFIRSSKDVYTSENNVRPSFIVGVYGEKKFEFSTDNIKVYVDGNPHRIITYEELLKELNDEFGARMATAKTRWEAESFDAQQNSVKDLDDPSVFHPGENKPGTRATEVRLAKTTIDAKQLSEDMIDADFKLTIEGQAIQQELVESLKTLQASALIKREVAPKEWYPGKVTLDYISDNSISHKIKIIVSVFGEDHEFLLDYVKVQ